MSVRKFHSKLLGQDCWGFDARIKGRRVRKIGFSSKENAELALSKLRIAANERRAGVAPKARITVKQLVDARCKQIGETRPSRKHSGVVLHAWLDTLPKGLLVEDLTTAHMSKYADARLEKVKAQTVWREVTDIATCLSRAREIFSELADWRPPRRPRAKVPHSFRSVTITSGQAKSLLEQLRRPREEIENSTEYGARLDAADFFEIALQTMGRSDEIRTLRWVDIYWKEKKLRIDSKKTGVEGVIFIPDSLVELFKRRRTSQDPASVYIFPSRRNPLRPICRFPIQILRRAAAALEIPWGYGDPQGIVLHTTRHTGVTALLEAGFDLATVQAQSRHSTQAMLMRYSHSNADGQRATTRALAAFLTAPEVSRISSTSSAEDTDNSPLTPQGGD